MTILWIFVFGTLVVFTDVNYGPWVMLWRLLEEAGVSPSYCRSSFGEMLGVRRFTLVDGLVLCFGPFGEMSTRKKLLNISPPPFFLKLHMRLNKKLPRKWNLPLVLTNGFLESFLCENGNTIRLWITFLHWYDFPLARTEFQGIICIFLHLGFSSTIGEYIEVPE